MSEHSDWDTLRDLLRIGMDRGHVMRVENPAAPGTPDVNYCLKRAEGWIEMKHEPRWKRGPRIKVKIRTSQIDWHEARTIAGGRCFILLHVGGDWFLVRGHKAREMAAGITRDRLIAIAWYHWEDGWSSFAVGEGLRAALTADDDGVWRTG